MMADGTLTAKHRAKPWTRTRPTIDPSIKAQKVKRTRNWIPAALLLPFAVFCTSTGVAKAGNPTSPDFVAKVIKVDHAGIVYFEGNGGRRLWGLIVDADYLRELIVGKTLSCVDAGETHGHWGGRDQKSCFCLLLGGTR